MVYLPIRVRPERFAVGVKEGASFLPPRPRATSRPVVHYGTSIVNGGMASRPGLVFPSIMSRLADVEVVNFGFSGAGRMELPMADVVAGVDALPNDDDCTMDHCHPNDYGFAQMGRVYADAVKGILGK